MLKVCAFGEILMRLTPSEKAVFEAVPDRLEMSFGGAEANFLASMSNFGAKTYFISALPDNQLGRSALRYLGKFSIDRRGVIISDKGRMGLYFLQEGKGNRPSEVIYDRKGSSINRHDFEDYDFAGVFERSSHFHLSGVTPAVSEKAMYTALRSARLAKEMGLTVSCDLNYRSRLWKYRIRGEKADPGKVMSELAFYCDHLTGNETDIQEYFKTDTDDRIFKYGKDDIVYYENLLLKVSQMFPHIRIIALSLRRSVNADSNFIGGVLYIRETNQFYFSPNTGGRYAPLLVEPIADRVGSGDAFSAGLVFGLYHFKDLQRALDFAVGSSVLKHSYKGDFSYASFNDIKSLMQGDRYGRIRR